MTATASAAVREEEREERATSALRLSTRRLLYAGVAIVALVQVLAFLAVQGLVTRFGTQFIDAPWKPAVAFLASAVVLASALESVKLYPWRRTGRRATSAEVHDFLLAAAGTVVGVALATVADLAAVEGSPDAMLFATAGVLAALSPIAYLDMRRRARVRGMEERFPDFLRDLVENQKAALTMPAALRLTAKGEYGPLTPYVQRMAKQMSWGVPFEEALADFGENVGTPLVRRTVHLVVRATQTGGEVSDVLVAAARDAREIKLLEQERRFTMTIYVLVIYVSFAVYLAVVAALQGIFVPAMLESTRGAGSGFGGVTIAKLDASVYADFFFASGFVQALGSGGMAGLLAEGGVSAGLKHVAVMLALAFVVLAVIL